MYDGVVAVWRGSLDRGRDTAWYLSVCRRMLVLMAGKGVAKRTGYIYPRVRCLYQSGKRRGDGMVMEEVR